MQPHPRVLALIQAGGKGSRMDVLTRESPKPALPFAGSYRLIDFPLSNLFHSQIADVWLSVQYLGQTLGDYVGNGSAWDLDRRHGGFRLMMPEQGAGGAVHEGFSSGNAEELYSRRDAIRRFGADAVLVLSADHVYRCDYATVVAGHLERDAECTIVTTEVAVADASHHGVVDVAADGRVTGFANKPDDPSSGVVASEVFVFRPDVLIAVLEELHRERAALPEPSDEGLGDVGETLLPALVARGRVFAHALPGYWRDVGRPEAYLAAHRELIHDDVGLFSDRATPVLSNGGDGPPARIRADATVDDSLLGDGCDIGGIVRTSVLGPNVVVHPGARVRDSVLFGDVVVEAGARVDWAIVDEQTVIGSGARVGASNPDQTCSDEYITLIGKDCRITTDIPRGGRLEPGTTT